MKSKQKRKKRKKIDLKPKGYDFGIFHSAMLVATPDFNKDLSLSNITGCAYGEIYSEELEQSIPSISLIAENEEYIKRAFEQFHAWCENQDGDSVNVEFIFLNSGGYLLLISPEIKRLKDRIGRYDRLYDPILFNFTWIKPIDTASDYLKSISEYSKKLLAPIHFSATIHPALKAYSDFKPDNAINLKGIIKFDTHFYYEDDLEENNPAYYFVKMHQDEKGKTKSKIREPEKQTVSECFDKRRKIMLRNFFMTLQRYKKNKKLQILKEKLKESGIREWQIEQGICNLVLSREHFNSNLHYSQARVSKHKDEIFDALRNHHEKANSEDSLHFIVEENLIEQIKLDSFTLLKYFGNNPRSNEIEYLLKGLEKMELLDQ